ncbi:hypothetical protein BDV25DRAFT_156430 [Aspergillus avenaceus]|uniref:Uncharacterized protein n=1 Tax=Aspergillus avenaceus TaxID=36643 RepID=A0A5N6TSS9_ASPAV|nr:hypothetical protein BDV25DRAFT_156430 [Aspergillus avenaceus]
MGRSLGQLGKVEDSRIFRIRAIEKTMGINHLISDFHPLGTAKMPNNHSVQPSLCLLINPTLGPNVHTCRATLNHRRSTHGTSPKNPYSHRLTGGFVLAFMVVVILCIHRLTIGWEP